jgi:hypothetical protein
MASCLFKARVVRRDLLRGSVILSVLQNWAKSVRLRCCRTPYRRVLTVIGARAGEPDKSRGRFDALACVINNTTRELVLPRSTESSTLPASRSCRAPANRLDSISNAINVPAFTLSTH